MMSVEKFQYFVAVLTPRMWTLDDVVNHVNKVLSTCSQFMNARNIAWNARIIALKVERKGSETKVKFVSWKVTQTSLRSIIIIIQPKAINEELWLKTHEHLLR